MLVTPPMSILRALPLFVFSYTCHQNIFSITNELANPTPSRNASVAATAVTIALGAALGEGEGENEGEEQGERWWQERGEGWEVGGVEGEDEVRDYLVPSVAASSTHFIHPAASLLSTCFRLHSSLPSPLRSCLNLNPNLNHNPNRTAGVYMVLGSSGYATFGSLVAKDILTSYPTSSLVVSIARLSISLVVTSCYPLQAHPSRACVTTILKVRPRFRFRVELGGWVRFGVGVGG